MAEIKPASIVDVRNYFGYENAAEFRSDWSKLTDADKNDLKNGIGAKGTGSMTY